MKALSFLFIFISLSTFSMECGTEHSLPNTKSTVMTDDSGNFRVWTQEDRMDLTYCISDKFGKLKPKIIEAMEVATKDWMSSGNFVFTYDPSADDTCDSRNGPKTRFRIAIAKSRRTRYAARAFFPYDERNTVIFKKSYVEKEMSELLRLTRHELGHVLGLRHEHIREENPLSKDCFEDTNFSGVTEYDSSSIMHYRRCGGTGGKELSESDREGIALLYPFD